MFSRTKQILSVSILAFGVMSIQLQAQPKVCQKISGSSTETILPKDSAPNDPFGRIVGLFTGSFAGTSAVPMTAFLTTPPTFSPGFPIPATVIEVQQAFVTGPGDTVTAKGKVLFNPGPASLPGENTTQLSKCPGTPCMVQVPQQFTITGGTGRWVGASGQLRNIGIGNLNLPQGQGSFTFLVDGEVCLPASAVGANGSAERY